MKNLLSVALCLWLTAAVSVLVALPAIADAIKVRAVQLKQTNICIEVVLEITDGLAPQVCAV